MMEDEELTGKENDDDELETSAGGVPLKRDLGVQPIDAVITEHTLKNHDVMQMNRGSLTHKQISKARKGRRLSPKLKLRVTTALNACLKAKGVERQYGMKDLFNY